MQSRAAHTNRSYEAVAARPIKSDVVGFAAGLGAQRAYSRSLPNGLIGLVIAPTFVRSVRRSGYLSTATALYELIDNSLEARARSIHVVLGFAESVAKPSAIAVIDDGHGMEPKMLRLALAWGGTHRENGRAGFGRFGYGLPTASMSQGRRFSVFSQAPSHALYGSVFDLDDLEGKTKGHRSNGANLLPTPSRRSLPPWIAEYVDKLQLSLGSPHGHGTAVVIDKLDSLTWKTAVALERNLDRAIGVTYRNFMSRPRRFFMQGRRVSPVDPLFLTPNARHFDLDSDRAASVPTKPIEVLDDKDRSLGIITVRAAYFPPTFARIDKSREASGLNANARFAIMKETNGIVVLRQGRQVDVVTSGLWTQFQNNDRYWAIEIDFPPALDELFSVTTNKQRVIFSDALKDALQNADLPELVEQLRARYKRDRQSLGPPIIPATATPAPDRTPASAPTPIDRRHVPDGTFYLVRDDGSGVTINEAHPFFDRLYRRLSDLPDAQAVIDAVLGALAQSETEANPQKKRFYRDERRRWSDHLKQSLESAPTEVIPSLASSRV